MDRSARTKTLVAVTVAGFSGTLMSSSVNIALPVISREFALDAITLTWIVTAYFLASSVFLLPAGRLADIYGRKRIFAYGIIIFTAASVLCAFSTSGTMLIISRAVNGVGNALMVAPGTAIIVATFPPQERGKALGTYLAAVYLGITLGPLIGGLLTQYLTWRSLFLLNVPSGLLVLFLLWQMRKSRDEATGERFDLTGGLICGLAIILLIYGLTILPGVPGFWLVLAGVAGILVFVWWENRTKFPLLNMGLFRHNRGFTFSNLAAFINYSATFAVSFLLSLYLQYIKGFSPQNAGLVLVAMPAIQAIFSPVAGRLSDRVTPRTIASIGMVFTTVALCLLIFLSDDTSIGYIIASLIILGFGLALFASPNTSAIMSSVANSYYGIASATLSIMRQMGIMFSMGIVSVIFSLYIGRVEIIPQYYPAFLTSAKIALGIFAVLCFGGIFASLARGQMKEK